MQISGRMHQQAPRVAARGSMRQAVAAVRPARAVSRRPLQLAAMLTFKDDASGVQFNVAQKFWHGQDFHCLGAATRNKKIVLINVKVYSVALFVEGARAAKELGLRARGGFFTADGDFCQAILDGAFNKALVVHLVRDVDGQQFSDAIDKAVLPKMKLMGELEPLKQFNEYFSNKSLVKDTEVILFWDLSGELQVLVTPPAPAPVQYDKAAPGLAIKSAGMARALFEVFLGEASSVPEARAVWIKGTKLLLESDTVKRETR